MNRYTSLSLKELGVEPGADTRGGSIWTTSCCGVFTLPLRGVQRKVNLESRTNIGPAG